MPGPPSRLRGREPGEEVGTGAGVQHVPRLDPCPACLRDAPAQIRELTRVVRVRVDRQEAALGERAPRPFDREVQPVGGAVHLEDRAGSRGGSVDRVPVEVEVVARADHPARWVGNDVHVRVLDRVEHALGQLGAWLAPRDVERRDDEVERGEELVRVVELPVRADLELAAVEQPETLGVRLGGAVPPASSALKRSFRSGSARAPPRPAPASGPGRWRATAYGPS